MHSERKEITLTRGLLTLIAMLLAFILVLVFIWRWYDLKNASLDKQQPDTISISK